MEKIMEIVAYIACVAVWFRFRAYLLPKRFKRGLNQQTRLPLVSIIIPVRNEVNNISHALTSLLHQDEHPYEIIVVDDNSSDHTKQLAESFGVKVVDAGPKPDGWAGKNWACHVGSQHANGEILLFTDADTRHYSKGLQKGVNFLQKSNADMISCPAFHLNKLWWEKLLGPFYCLIHAGASPFDKPTEKNAYAIGQYLMIRKEAYETTKGHAAIKGEIAEDSAMAKHLITSGKKYVMYNGAPLFAVQMYGTFDEFVKGWLRIMRLGMKELSAEVIFNSFLPVMALNLWNIETFTWHAWLPTLATLICFAIVQRRIGRFNVVGEFFFPIPVLFFIVLGLASSVSDLLKLPIQWRGRIYSTGSSSSVV